jgi:hypothetical protein
VEGESRYGRISRDLLMRPDRGRLPYSWQWAPSYAAHIKEGHAGGTETNVCRAHTMPPHIQQTDRSPCATEVRGRPHYLSPPQSRSVVEAMEDEMRSMSTNRVWDLEEISKGAKTVGCKWVYKTKCDSKENIERFKARLVAKCFTQREDIDYAEIFSPVSWKDSLRIIMALVAHYDLELHQIDVKTTFLNGNLLENVYMAQLKGFAVKGKEHMGCRLKKSIYGLKQDSRQ